MWVLLYTAHCAVSLSTTVRPRPPVSVASLIPGIAAAGLPWSATSPRIDSPLTARVTVIGFPGPCSTELFTARDDRDQVTEGRARDRLKESLPDGLTRP